MPYNHNKVNELAGGWYAVFKDGSVITEEDMSWIEIPSKINIKLVGLKRHNKYYELEGKLAYLPPGETHMRELSMSVQSGVAVTKQSLIGWYIGYYDIDARVYWRVDAITGNFTEERVLYADTP